MTGNWSDERMRDLVVVTCMSFAGLLSFAKLCMPICSGNPHSVRPNSPIIQSFPCNVTALSRVGYLCLWSPYIPYELTQVARGDFWYGVPIQLFLCRLVAALLLPERWYTDVVAPVLMYIIRTVGLVYHLWQGPQHVPTDTAVECLFLWHMFGDLLVFLTLQRTSAWVEAVFGLASTACAAVLCSWYGGGRLPHFTVSMARVVATRLLVSLFNVYMHFMLHRRRPADRAQGGGRARGAAPEGAAGRKGLEAVDGGAVGPSSTAAGRAAKRCPQAVVPEPPVPALAGRDRRSGSYDRYGNTNGGNGVCHTSAPPPGTAAAMAPPGCAAPTSGDLIQAVHPAPPLETALDDGTELTSGPPAPPRPAVPPYKPFIRRHVRYYKIDGSDPHQLGPGWEGRLSEVMAARGVHLAGSYVRQGCIELVLDVEELGGGPAGAAPEEGPDWPALAAALHLQPAGAAEAAATLLADVRVLSICGSAPSAGASSAWGVASLRPRVLLLPDQDTAAAGAPLVLRLEVQTPPATGGDPALSPAAPWAAAGADDRSGAGVKAATEAPAWEVLVRAQGRYMAALVRQLSAAESGASGPGSAQQPGSGPDPTAARFDIELQSGPLEPGVLQVDVRRVGVPCCVLPVLLLAPSERALCGELRGVVERWQGPESGGEDTAGGLLADVGACLYDFLSLSGAQAAALASHVLAFAEVNGLRHTAARLRAGAELAGGTTQPEAGCEAAPEAALGASPGAPPSHSQASASGPAFAEGAGCGRLRPPDWWWRLRWWPLVEGWSAVIPAEAEAYQTCRASWIAAQAHVLGVMEVLAVAAAWYRIGPETTSTAVMLWLIHISASIVTTFAWPFLSRDKWRQLAMAVRVPRIILRLATTGCLYLLRVPSPRSVSTYRNGLGLVFIQGLLLASTSVLSLRGAVLLAVVRLPLNCALLCDGGDCPRWTLRGLLLSARVEAVALATTLACHVYLRGAARAQRNRQAQPRAGPKAADSAAGSKAGKDD